MYKGEPTEGIVFYKLLYEDDEFCKELGKAMLAAGRLEAKLINYLLTLRSELWRLGAIPIPAGGQPKRSHPIRVPGIASP